jgi:hypothetical protein
MRVLLICHVPEMAATMGATASAVREAFDAACRAHGHTPHFDVITRRDHDACVRALGAVADHLALPNARAVVYYYGHGDQVRDTSGDEADGMDEAWTTQGILDDELSAIFSRIHDSSRLYLFSDSCSSGSMVDASTNGRPWVAIGSARDTQDSLATSEGGAFTVWGLIPALAEAARASGSTTPRQLVERIRAGLVLDTQTCTLTAGNTRIADEPMF